MKMLENSNKIATNTDPNATNFLNFKRKMISIIHSQLTIHHLQSHSNAFGLVFL